MGRSQLSPCFVDETRLTGLRFNLISATRTSPNCRKKSASKKVLAAARSCSSVHLHGQSRRQGRASSSLRRHHRLARAVKSSSLRRKLVCRLSWNEGKTGAEAPTVAEQLATAPQSLDRFEFVGRLRATTEVPSQGIPAQVPTCPN